MSVHSNPPHTCNIAHRAASVDAGTRERLSDSYVVTTAVSCFAESLQKEEAWKISGLEALDEPLYFFFALGATPTISIGDYVKLTSGVHNGKTAEVVWVGKYDWPNVQTQALANVCVAPSGVF